MKEVEDLLKKYGFIFVKDRIPNSYTRYGKKFLDNDQYKHIALINKTKKDITFYGPNGRQTVDCENIQRIEEILELT